MSQEVNYKHDKEKQKVWFPYSVSAEPDDFIVQNGVHGHCPVVVVSPTAVSCRRAKLGPIYFNNLYKDKRAILVYRAAGRTPALQT